MKINQVDIKEFNAFINTIDLKKISKDKLIEYYKNSVATEFGAMAFTDRNKAERNEFLKNQYIQELKQRKYSITDQDEYNAIEGGQYDGEGSYSAEEFAWMDA